MYVDYRRSSLETLNYGRRGKKTVAR